MLFLVFLLLLPVVPTWAQEPVTPSVRFVGVERILTQEVDDPNSFDGSTITYDHFVYTFALFKVNQDGDRVYFTAWIIRNSQTSLLADWRISFSANNPPGIQEVSVDTETTVIKQVVMVVDDLPYRSETISHPQDGTQTYYFYRMHFYFDPDTFNDDDLVIVEAEYMNAPLQQEAAPSVRFITAEPISNIEIPDPAHSMGGNITVDHLIYSFALFKVNEWADRCYFKAWILRNGQLLPLADWSLGFSAHDQPGLQGVYPGSAETELFNSQVWMAEFPYTSEVITHPEDGTQKYYFYRAHFYLDADTFSEDDQVIIKGDYMKEPIYAESSLVVASVPSGVPFTVDDVECIAPWSADYVESAVVTLTMPESYSYEGQDYTWSKWNDGNSDRTRSVTVTKKIALTGVFTLENESAALLVLSPENRTYSASTVPLVFKVNGTVIGPKYSLDGQENLAVFNNTTLVDLSDGPHTIIMYGENTLGDTVSSELVHFSVDIGVPSVGFSLLSPENRTYNNSDIPLTYTKNETCYLSYYSLDGEPNYPEPGNITLNGLADGPHQLEICVNYTGGTEGEIFVVDFTVETAAPDTTPPEVSVISPANTTYLSDEVYLTFAVDEHADSMWYILDDHENITITENTTLTELANGMHSLLVYAKDTSGNIAPSNTIYFNVYSPILDIIILSPENLTYNTSDLPISYLVNETNTSIVYNLDEQPHVDAENVTVLSGLADGVHKLTVIANFTNCSISESATVWFTVDTTAPSIVDVVQLPVNATGTLEDGAKVNATVTDALSEVNWVALNYTIDNGTWTTTWMTNLDGNLWNSTLPAFPHGTTVTYKIIAKDIVGNIITTEELFGQPNQYQVLPEFPQWLIIALLLTGTLMIKFYRRKLSKKQRS